MKKQLRREGKEVAFQNGTYSLKTIDIRYNMFLLDIHKKTNSDFPNKIHANYKKKILS